MFDLDFLSENLTTKNIIDFIDIFDCKNIDIIKIRKFNYFVTINKKFQINFYFKQNKEISSIYLNNKKLPLGKNTILNIYEILYKFGVKINMKNIFNKNDISYYYMQKYLNQKGFNISKSKNNITEIFLNGNIIFSLNHNKQRIIENDFLVTDDFKQTLYELFQKTFINFNLELNNIRNQLFNNCIDNKSYENLNNKILLIQNHFNNFYDINQ